MLVHFNISNSVFISCSPYLKRSEREEHSSLLSQGHSDKLVKTVQEVKTVHAPYSTHLDISIKK